MVLITHDHFDHFDEKTITAALQARPELQVYAPAAVETLLLPTSGPWTKVGEAAGLRAIRPP
jgi:L-ascorbate metabolism protein UlaG (beta-lactamase superfamily)